MTVQTLEYLGFKQFVDFTARWDDASSEIKYTWISLDKPQPTPAQIEAARPAAEVWWARRQIRPVTRRQMLTALHRAGLLATIKAAVAASNDIEVQIAFDESQEFQRDNAFLAAMAAALGKTDAEIDAVFALAASL